MADIISSKTRRAFQEAYVSHSVLREIRNDFDDAGVELGGLSPGRVFSSSRRSLVERYYQSVDWTSPNQVRQVLDAFESHLNRLEDYNTGKELERLVMYLKRDGLSYSKRKINFTPDDIDLIGMEDHKLGIDLTQLRINIDRIKKTIEGDPALAIGSSKELVESCCKAILTEKGKTFSTKADILELVRQVADNLNLISAKVPNSKKGSSSIKRVLGSLANIVQGLAELRNLYGSGHGKSPGHEGLSPRHARLCAGAASTLSTFLMETSLKDKKS